MTASINTVDGNTTYEIRATEAGRVDVNLSPRVLYLEGRTSVSIGDTVTVRGVSGNPWRMLSGWAGAFTARSPSVPYYIATENLPGNTAPGQAWTRRSPAQPWQAIATEAEGSLIVAAPRAGGPLHVSNDGGATWSTEGSPVGDWSSVHTMRMRRIACCTENGAAFRAAAARGGSVYRGGEFGGWVFVPGSEPGAVPGPQAWEAVVALPYGSVTAAVLGGPIYTNAGGGSNVWTAAIASGASTPLLRRWRALAVALYNPLVAVNEEGEVWLSSDGARTFTPIPVRVDGVAVTTPWHRVAISEDGRTIAVAGASASAVYLSRDAGQSWVRTPAPVGDYTGLALSRDGQVISAAAAAGVQMSRDGGASFSALPVPAGGGWTGTAVAGDGNLVVVAGSDGALLTSLGNRTSYASGGGGITGGPGQAVEMEFALDAAGRQHYRVRSSIGGPFRID